MREDVGRQIGLSARKVQVCNGILLMLCHPHMHRLTDLVSSQFCVLLPFKLVLINNRINVRKLGARRAILPHCLVHLNLDHSQACRRQLLPPIQLLCRNRFFLIPQKPALRRPPCLDRAGRLTLGYQVLAYPVGAYRHIHPPQRSIPALRLRALSYPQQQPAAALILSPKNFPALHYASLLRACLRHAHFQCTRTSTPLPPLVCSHLFTLVP